MGNKNDSLNRGEFRNAKKIACSHKSLIIQVSAKNGQGISTLQDLIISHIININRNHTLNDFDKPVSKRNQTKLKLPVM